jgi:predicted metal-binding membrane protein
VFVSPILVAVLKRDRTIVAFGLAGVATLSWTYLIYMDWGMRHMDVGMDMVIMPAMEHWTAWDLVLVFLMWAVMMVAMMVPAASPVIVLFAEINRRRNEHQGTFVSTGQFLLGYLTAWTGFSVLATLAQWGLLTAALVSPMMESTSKALGAGLLLGAGLFQFSRLKYACLAHCRSPMGFLATEWQDGSWLGSMDCFWLVKLRQLGMHWPASRRPSLGDSTGDPTVGSDPIRLIVCRPRLLLRYFSEHIIRMYY